MSQNYNLSKTNARKMTKFPICSLRMSWQSHILPSKYFFMKSVIKLANEPGTFCEDSVISLKSDNAYSKDGNHIS